MYRATTPTHKFEIPFDVATISQILITYAQQEEVVLEKKTEDCTIDGNCISVTLTQEEANLFDLRKNIEIQMRVLTAGGNALASQIITEPCYRVLNDEVLI